MFTDGIPGQSGYDSGVADDAIRAADTTKTTYGADVYAIGIFDGADATKSEWGNKDADKGNYFMQRLSSNNGTPQSPSYYLTASNSSELNAVFDSISQTTGSSKLDLDETTVVKDVLTQYFTFPEGFSAEDVEIYTQAYDGTEFEGQLSEETTAQASIDSTTGAVSVTNYDFSTHFISENGRDKDNPNASGDYHGEKLIIRFTIVPKEEFWGGNLVPTNNVEKSGVYESDENLVENFPEPVPVDVPLKEISLTAKDQNIYYSNTAPTAEELVNKITPPDDWRTDYVNRDIVYKVDENVSNTEDGSYTVTATLKPKYDGTEPPSTSEPVTARVNVFKPVVTWKDTTQDTNTAVDKSFDGNKVSTVWKHGETEANSVLMHGTEPTLSFTFAQADSNAIPDTLTQELHVKVASVTANTQNLSSVTTFAWTANADSEGCSSTCVNPNPEYQFRIHLATGSLTITKKLTSFNSTMGSDATFIFEITNDKGQVWYRYLTFDKTGSATITMENLPAGTYTVKELASAGYQLASGSDTISRIAVGGSDSGTASFTNQSTGGDNPGDQSIVRNNFTYKDGVWQYTQSTADDRDEP